MMIAVEEVYPHPSWDGTTGTHDVMLVKLAASSSAQWVKVNSDSSIPTYGGNQSQVEAIGIGATSSTATGTAANLQVIDLVHITDQNCFALVQGIVSGNFNSFFTSLPSDHLCITNYGMTMDGQCSGDEGGPMIRRRGRELAHLHCHEGRHLDKTKDRLRPNFP